MHKLNAEPPTEGYHLHGGLCVLGKGGVEETEAETVLKVSDGVNKRRIPLPGTVKLWSLNGSILYQFHFSYFSIFFVIHHKF